MSTVVIQSYDAGPVVIQAYDAGTLVETQNLIPTPADLGAIHYWNFNDGQSVTGLVDGADIVTLTDLVGGVNLIPDSVGEEPTWRSQYVGGKDAIHFDGTQFLKTASAISVGAFTVFMVAQIEANASATTGMAYELTASGTSVSGLYLNAGRTGVILAKNAGGQSAYNTNVGWWSESTPQCTIQRCTGTHAGHTLFVNGEQRALDVLGGFTGDPGTATITDTFFVGGRNGGTAFPITGWISEIAIFNSAISDTVRDQLNEYFLANYDGGY